MNDIIIHFGQRKLLLNNNSDKYNRAKKDAGENPTEFEILAHYDKHEGLIQDENGKKLENGQYWAAYQKWRTEGEKMIAMLDENIKDIRATEAQLLIPLNDNVAQKRTFLGTLMTISAAIIAGLFFVFTKDPSPLTGCSLLLAQLSAISHAAFIFMSSFWLTAILGQESARLDRKINFYRTLPDEMYGKVGKEIRSEDAFNNYLKEKLSESKSLDTEIYFQHEYYFYAICGLFIIALLPIAALFFIVAI